MVIELSGSTAQRLAEFAESTGRSVTEIVQNAVEKELRSRIIPQEGKMSPKQKQAVLNMLDEARRMPVEPIPERYLGKDEDEVIYGDELSHKED